jgi:Flp pilus assembly pilin Flp
MKTVFTFYKNSQKGQDLVEYALMLAIIIGIGWGIYSQTGVADSIKNVFGNASSLMETAKKNTGTVDINAIIDRIEAIQTGYRDGPYGMGYTRGLIQSSWLKNGDEKDSTIGKLASELDATMWTYYNGQNPNKRVHLESGVLYWTTENLDSVTLTPNDNTSGNNWSKETVLSYRYDPNDKQNPYSVIKNHVWLDQPGADGNNHKGLAQLSGEYNKPAGTIVGKYSTYEEARQAYETEKRKK